MAFRKPWIAASGRADARAAALFLQVRLARRNAVHRQRQPPRRRKGLRAFIDQALGDELVGDHAAQIVRRLRLHARGNFFGEQLEQTDRASARSPEVLCASRRRAAWFCVRLQVQKNTRLVSGAMYCIGSNGVPSWLPSQNGWLLRAAAGAPPIFLAGGDLDGQRRPAADGRLIAHVALPASVCTQASPQAFASSRTRKM